MKIIKNREPHSPWNSDGYWLSTPKRSEYSCADIDKEGRQAYCENCRWWLFLISHERVNPAGCGARGIDDYDDIYEKFKESLREG